MRNIRQKIALVALITVAVTGAFFVLHIEQSTQDNPTGQSPAKQKQISTSEPEIVFNKQLYSTTEPSSIWFVANKHFALPTSYTPSDLVVLSVPLRLSKSEEQMKFRKVGENDLAQLFNDSKSAGLQLQFGSGYRSAAYQKVLYDGYVSSMGKVEADRSSARPGHSEHQTGLSLDFTRVDGKCHLESCFGETPEGEWLALNAYKYGFILRYPSNKEATTGYMYEPWHFRYVGQELAKEMHQRGVETLEELFNLGNAPDYL